MCVYVLPHVWWVCVHTRVEEVTSMWEHVHGLVLSYGEHVPRRSVSPRGTCV